MSAGRELFRPERLVGYDLEQPWTASRMAADGVWLGDLTFPSFEGTYERALTALGGLVYPKGLRAERWGKRCVRVYLFGDPARAPEAFRCRFARNWDGWAPGFHLSLYWLSERTT